jgi:hypothetical protein
MKASHVTSQQRGSNCFAGNVFETDDPPGIVAQFPC